MIKKIGSNKYGVVEYAISSVEDIADLPLGVAIGSTAVLINKDGIRTFALGEGEWVEYIDAERYDKNKLAQDLLFCGFGNDGEKHDDLDDRLMVEFDEINERVNVGNYLEYNGCDVKADYSLEGLQRGVMLEGRTLQNLCVDYSNEKNTFTLKDKVTMLGSDINYASETYRIRTLKFAHNLKPNTTYTIIINIHSLETLSNGLGNYIIDGDEIMNYSVVSLKGVGVHIKKFTTNNIGAKTMGLYIDVKDTSATISCPIILEGDHTNTLLEELPFIEGIKSVGESELTDEGYKISGKSCGKNLCVGEGNYHGYYDNTNNVHRADNNKQPLSFNLKPNTTYTRIMYNCEFEGDSIYMFDSVNETDGTCKQYPYYLVGSTCVTKFTTGEKGGINEYVFNPESGIANTPGFSLKIGKLVILEGDYTQTPLEELSYEPYQETTYSYILDEPLRSLPNGVCDTIDLETGVLTRRVGKAVLDENRSWWVSGGVDRGELSIEFATSINPLSTSNKMNLLCDKFYNTTIFKDGGQSICCTGKILYLVILKSNLTSLDSQGIKRWLQDNPTTVYYELAEPTIHQLDQNRIYSFKDTTHVTSDNLIAPRITTNILTNSNALISHLRGENLALANEVSTLSLRNRETQETNETQDHIIDASLCAVDELYMMYETTQEIEAMSADEEGSRMVDMYVAMVQRGLKTIDQVPVRYREKVREILAQLED